MTNGSSSKQNTIIRWITLSVLFAVQMGAIVFWGGATHASMRALERAVDKAIEASKVNAEAITELRIRYSIHPCDSDR